MIVMTWNTPKPLPEVKIEDLWKPAKEIVHEQGLKILAWGDAEVGKTFLCLSAPPPVYIVDTEFGSAPVIRHFKDKEIFVYEAAILDPTTSEPDPDLSLKKVEKALVALKNVTAGTIVIDSGTDVWDWLQAWMERTATKRTKTKGVYRFEWARVKQRWRQMVLRLMAKPLHFIITAQPQEIYDAEGRATGTYRPRIQRATPFMVDLILKIDKVYEKGSAKPKHISTLTKCRFQRAYNTEIEDVTFDKLCQKLKDDLGVVVKGANVS